MGSNYRVRITLRDIADIGQIIQSHGNLLAYLLSRVVVVGSSQRSAKGCETGHVVRTN